MQRRSFMALLGVLLAGPICPLSARAQEADGRRRIAILMAYAESDAEPQSWVVTLRDALQRLGWTDHNIRIDVRWVTGDRELIQNVAKEVVASQPELVVASTTVATAALLQHTRTLPIVFALVSDPVGSGFVASFPRPGGNVTGFTTMEPTMATKWLELFKEVAPHVTRVGFLFNPASAPYIDFYLNPFKAVAPSFAVKVVVTPVNDSSDLESAIVAQAREPNGGLFVWSDAFMTAHRAEIKSLLARSRLPAVSPFRIFVDNGCLLSYGSDSVDNFRRAASYVDRILSGDKPSELPVQAPVKFELAVNLKTAKALGLTVPQSLFARADEVIE